MRTKQSCNPRETRIYHLFSIARKMSRFCFILGYAFGRENRYTCLRRTLEGNGFYLERHWGVLVIVNRSLGLTSFGHNECPMLYLLILQKNKRPELATDHNPKMTFLFSFTLKIFFGNI